MHRYLSRMVSVVLLSAAALLGACGDDDEELLNEDAGDGGAESAAPDVSLASDAADGGGDGDAADANASDGDASDASTVLNDLQIIWIMHVFNVAEIQEGQLALMRAVATEARTYANQMITAHTMEDAALAALFASGDAEAGDADTLDAALTADGSIPTAESEISRALAQQAALQIQELGFKSNKAFDLSYMSGQVANHSEIIQLIDILQPAATSAALKMNLTQTRPIEAAHLTTAIQTLNTIRAVAGTD